MAIDVAGQIRYWRDGSADDLEAARTLLDARQATEVIQWLTSRLNNP